MSPAAISPPLPDAVEKSAVDRTADDADASTAPARRAVARRLASAILVLLLVAAVMLFGSRYWAAGRFIESTDDAYVKADSSTIAPKVSGYIASILIDDNQSVKAGQILARIDDADLETASEQAAAAVAAAAASIANLNAQLAAQQWAIRQAQANVSMAQVALALSERHEARRREMARVGYGSDEQADDASADHRAKASQMQHEEAAGSLAQRQIKVLAAQKNLAEAQLRSAEAVQQQAALNLSYATIRAPIDGTVGARSARVGQFVQAGTQLMELVPLAWVYVIANFKETQVTHMRPGQPARIKVDAFPESELRAQVASLAPASGLEFSLLPPDNATGNFTKIVQRMPIKIALEARGPLAGRLRPGMSVTVSIDTKEAVVADRQQPDTGERK